MVTPDTFAPVIGSLLEERDVGLLLAAVTLLLGVISRFGASELQQLVSWGRG